MGLPPGGGHGPAAGERAQALPAEGFAGILPADGLGQPASPHDTPPGCRRVETIDFSAITLPSEPSQDPQPARRAAGSAVGKKLSQASSASRRGARRLSDESYALPEGDGPPSRFPRWSAARRLKHGHNDSCFATLVEQKWFENTTLVVITLNALWICVDTEWNNDALVSADGSLPLEPFSTVVENAFCAYFASEVVLRFFAFVGWLRPWRDPWFVFDFTLVLTMVVETWVLPVVSALSGDDSEGGALSVLSSFRLLRLLRLTRMVRLMRYLPELLTLVKGMIEAIYSVSTVFLFLGLMMYVFALVFTSLIGEAGYVQPEDAEDATAKTMFGDLGSALLALLTHAVLWDNLWQALMAIQEESLLLMMLFLFFSLLSGMCLLNMLIGVLCQVMHNTSHREAAKRQQKEMEVSLWNAFVQVDISGDRTVTEDEFKKFQCIPDARKALCQILAVDTDDEVQDRLDKLMHTLFRTPTVPASPAWNPDDGAEETDSRESSLLSAAAEPRHDRASSGRLEEGLEFDDFVERILELRWDSEASSLDVDVLRAHLEKSDSKLRRRLDSLEATLQAVLDAEGQGPPWERADPAAALAEEAGPRPPPEWLRQVPTELLFHALKSRAGAEDATPALHS